VERGVKLDPLRTSGVLAIALFVVHALLTGLVAVVLALHHQRDTEARNAHAREAVAADQRQQALDLARAQLALAYRKETHR
jgi:hypothetical protein